MLWFVSPVEANFSYYVFVQMNQSTQSNCQRTVTIQVSLKLIINIDDSPQKSSYLVQYGCCNLLRFRFHILHSRQDSITHFFSTNTIIEFVIPTLSRFQNAFVFLFFQKKKNIINEMECCRWGNESFILFRISVQIKLNCSGFRCVCSDCFCFFRVYVCLIRMQLTNPT